MCRCCQGRIPVGWRHHIIYLFKVLAGYPPPTSMRAPIWDECVLCMGWGSGTECLWRSWTSRVMIGTTHDSLLPLTAVLKGWPAGGEQELCNLDLIPLISHRFLHHLSQPVIIVALFRWGTCCWLSSGWKPWAGGAKSTLLHKIRSGFHFLETAQRERGSLRSFNEACFFNLCYIKLQWAFRRRIRFQKSAAFVAILSLCTRFIFTVLSDNSIENT